MKLFSSSLLLALSLSVSVQASGCGEPPLDQPAVPDAATATADDIRNARDVILAYSNKVDAYMACVDERTAPLVPYMTKKQRTRHDEDLTELHNARRDLQLALNNVIRAYRKRTN